MTKLFITTDRDIQNYKFIETERGIPCFILFRKQERPNKMKKKEIKPGGSQTKAKKNIESNDKTKKISSVRHKKQAEDDQKYKKDKMKYAICPKLVEQIIPAKTIPQPETSKIKPKKNLEKTAAEEKSTKSQIAEIKVKDGKKRKHRTPVDSLDFVYNDRYRKQYEKRYDIYRTDNKDDG